MDTVPSPKSHIQLVPFVFEAFTNFTSSPAQVVSLPAIKSACNLPTLIRLVIVSAHWFASLTTNTTSRLPWLKVCVGLPEVLLVPSPKYQLLACMLPADLLEKKTCCVSAQLLAGEGSKLALGAGFISKEGIVVLLEEHPFSSVTNSVAV